MTQWITLCTWSRSRYGYRGWPFKIIFYDIVAIVKIYGVQYALGVYVPLFSPSFSGVLNKINWLVREGFKKKWKKMVGLIQRGWLAGVSLGPKSNQKRNCFEKIIQRWSEWSNSSRKPKTLIFHYWEGQGRNTGC